MKRLALPIALASLALIPATAAAQATTTPTTPAAPVVKPVPPKPKPKAGTVGISVSGGQATKKLRYVATGSAVVLEATARPFIAGQTLELDVSRAGKIVSRQTAKIVKGSGTTGKARFRVTTHRSGLLKLTVVHKATDQLAAFSSRGAKIVALNTSAGTGSHGIKVLLLQRGLRKLGYAVPTDGSYGGGTERAVLAYRKANSLGRVGFASNHVFSLVLRGKGAFKARFPNAGKHVEFDWSRQVLGLFDGARPVNVYHASSGKPSTPTVFGTFHFYRKEPGTNSHGMVQSNYFIGGYAIHGYYDVPSYAASHGCIRVPIPNAYQIDSQISLGETIYVYR